MPQPYGNNAMNNGGLSATMIAFGRKQPR